MRKETKIFISHTKKDKKFCDEFDNAVARVGIPSFRSEYEHIEKPAWKRINHEINESIAFFLLVGEELVNSQESNDEKWRYTQNWIAYEVGVAAHAGKDLWVICDKVSINFPIPYVNNYLISGVKDESSFDYIRTVLKNYKKGYNYPCPLTYPEIPFDFRVVCPHDDCKLEFNLHNRVKEGGAINCPACLKRIKFEDGHY